MKKNLEGWVLVFGLLTFVGLLFLSRLQYPVYGQLQATITASIACVILLGSIVIHYLLRYSVIKVPK